MARGPAPRIQVKGAVELRRAMTMAEGQTKDLTAVHKAVADIVARAARTRVPIGKTHKLQKSIKGRATKTSARVRAGGDREGVVYAGPIHFGWPAHNIEPQPFLYDALDDRADDVIDLYNKRVEAIVRKIDAMTPG